MNLEVGEFITMPNHFHAILIIGYNQFNQDSKQEDEAQNKFGIQSKNLASVIRGFKAAVTKQAKVVNPAFAWQPLYHDHIIRNGESYTNITNYIINNPLKWHEDSLYIPPGE